jgi:hypothetical protein
MTLIVERVVTRAVPRADRRSWLRWGMAVFVSVEVLHAVGGVLVNEWEGWRVFFEIVAFVAVSGLVIVGLTFGLLVRWGLKRSRKGRNRPALASVAAGVMSVLSYVLFFMWTPLLVAPAAVLLGREGLTRTAEGEGARGYAIAGTLLGVASLALGVVLIAYALTHRGDFPFGLF